ncbi:MAG: hypothetical protein HONBIEJF_00973 [Fimbriimonadaceae bacterium]|nr:hypothetical protein [Fimbriimonadaceae bacterium]
MATLDDVRRIAAKLTGASEGTGAQFSFEVEVKGKRKGFVWSWMERTDPKRERVPNESVLAVRVPNLTSKELLLDSDPETFFTEPHYNGYPAVLVRLDAIALEDLENLIVEAWRSLVPRTREG